MAKKRSMWLWGCGLGCLGIVLVLGGLFGAGALWVGGMVQELDRATVSRHGLDERFGDPASFTPLPDGTIPAERIEAFLSIREVFAPARDAIAEAFASMPLSEEAKNRLKEKSGLQKVLAAFSIGRTAMGLGSEFGSFFETRNQAMLDVGMGMGEYSYIYVLAYYSWLGHSANDGPGSGFEEDGGRRRTTVDVGSRSVLNRVRRELRTILQNQKDALPEEAPEALRRQLDDQIELLEENRNKFPWQDGLPEAIEASLERFRDRLEATYKPETNAFELSRSRKRGKYSFETE